MPQCSFHSSRLFTPFLIHTTECRTIFTQILLLPKSYWRIWQIISQFMCTWSSTHVRGIQWSLAITLTFHMFLTCNQLMAVHSLDLHDLHIPHWIFEPYEDMNLLYSFISINTFQQFLCFCSNFPKSETKPDLLWLLHDNKEKHNYTKLLWVSSLR